MASLIIKRRWRLINTFDRNHRERGWTVRGVDGIFTGLVRQFGATLNMQLKIFSWPRLFKVFFKLFISTFNFMALWGSQKISFQAPWQTRPLRQKTPWTLLHAWVWLPGQGKSVWHYWTAEVLYKMHVPFTNFLPWFSIPLKPTSSLKVSINWARNSSSFLQFIRIKFDAF